MFSPRSCLVALGCIVLFGCGANSRQDAASSPSLTGSPSDSFAVPLAISKPTPAQASRFLAQATFGATTRTIDDVAAVGIDRWIDQQFALPQISHRTYLEKIKAGSPTGNVLSENAFFESFWNQAATADDQLRQRVAYSLSQIFVISFRDNEIAQQPIAAASFYDMLGENAFGNFRDLLQSVARHPAMGLYLTSLHNQKESENQTPDENFAREIMQLMSIGLYELNNDGSQKLINGAPVETYASADIRGMAKVFTGWSWAGPDKSDGRFFGGDAAPDREWQPMQGYPQFHSTTEKAFLGTLVPAQTTGDPEASQKAALGKLFNHPNVGPFIGRQLIQRLVTSNPSRVYVQRVAAAFANNGNNVRGDMKAVLRAILLDPEMRQDVTDDAVSNGRLREPILRLAGWMRAFGATSASKRFKLYNLDDPLFSLGQTPLRSPTVFNFYRPGYAPPNTSIAVENLVAPEMQIVGDTSVVGYINTMQQTIDAGIGTDGDIRASYDAELALADTPDKLLDRIDLLLMAGAMRKPLREQILTAVKSIDIPQNDKQAGALSRQNRVKLAILLTMASPQYLVQK